MNRDKKVQARITLDEFERIESMAYDAGCSISVIIRMALIKLLRDYDNIGLEREELGDFLIQFMPEQEVYSIVSMDKIRNMIREEIECRGQM